MGINVVFAMSDDCETHVKTGLLKALPRTGEVIWFYPSGSKEPCRVVDVCHMVSLEENNNYHDATIYLEAI